MIIVLARINDFFPFNFTILYFNLVIKFDVDRIFNDVTQDGINYPFGI